MARRSTPADPEDPSVIPTKQLAVSTFRAPNKGLPHILSVEVGDHVAYFSGGPGSARIFATSDAKKLHRRQAPVRGLRGIKIIGDELWQTGEFGTLAVSTDRGASWTQVATPNSECLWDIARDTKGAYWIGGSGKLILKSAKRGAPFKVFKHSFKARDDRADPRVEVVPAGVMFPLFNAYWDGKKLVKPKGLRGALGALATAPSGTIVMVGDNGAAFRSTDGGLSYKPVTTGVSVHLEDVAVVGGGFVIVGDKGTMRRSEDDGVTWKPVASGVKGHLWAISSWGTGAFVGGDDGVVLKIECPDDTYWNGAKDVFGAQPIVTANITPLRAPTDEERAARFAKLVPEAEAVHATLAAKLAAPVHKADDHTRAILAALDDVEEYKVLGDVLQAAGDPRGELIALQTTDNKAAAKYLKKHRATLLGDLATIPEKSLKLEWRNGFISEARIAYDFSANFEEDTEDQVIEWLVKFLDDAGTRFTQKLTLGIVQMDDNSYDIALREIGRRARPALRSLFVGDFDSDESEISWSKLGDVTQLCGACARLESLELHTGSMKLGKPGQLVFPRLRELEIVTGGLSRDSLNAITGAHLPSLERLSLYFGSDSYGCDIQRKDLKGLLESTRFPRLVSLGLRNSEFADELCSVLHLSPLVAQVRELALGLGTLSDPGARALATYARGLAHLEKLDISSSYVSPEAIRQLQKALPNTEIDAEHQRGGEFDRRYVSISE